MIQELLNSIKAVVGLFIPVKWDGVWGFTIAVGNIPIGWIIIATILIVKYL